MANCFYNEGNKHQNNNRVSTETVCHESTYMIVFLTRHTNPQTMKTTTVLAHRHNLSLALMTFCRWRHNWLLMTSQLRDNCDASTWIVIFNSLDIDFIHSDIHDRSCKKSILVCFTGWGNCIFVDCIVHNASEAQLKDMRKNHGYYITANFYKARVVCEIPKMHKTI